MSRREDTRCADALERAAAALRRGDRDGADFQLRCAAHIVDFKTLTTGRQYPVVVTWEIQPKIHRRAEVVVEAASRALAHDQAQVWARQSFNLTDETRLVSTIPE